MPENLQQLFRFRSRDVSMRDREHDRALLLDHVFRKTFQYKITQTLTQS